MTTNRYSTHSVKRIICAMALKISSIAVIMVIIAACSDHTGNSAPPQSAQHGKEPVVDNMGAPLDLSALREVKSFTDLPAGVQELANSSYMKVMYDNQYPSFVVGGINDSNAVVAYKVSAYIPVYRAQAYTRSQSGWVASKGWDFIDPVNSLQGLLHAIEARR